MKGNNLKTEISIDRFAYSLAHSGDDSQAEFINKLAYELKVCCNDSDLSGSQPCHRSDSLDSNGVDLIKSLYEFIKLRENNKPK